MIKKLLGVIALALFVTACTKVPAGNVGVKVHLLGSEKGVQVEELGVGRYWVGINEELYLFPTFTQTVSWEDNNAIAFQTTEGMVVKGNIGLTYSIEPSMATTLFQKYRMGVDEITDKFLKSMVRDAFNEKASTLKVDSIYGSGKFEMIREVEASVRSQVQDIGINIERIYYISELGLPPEVVDSLNAKIRATQMAEQRQNEIKQSKAEADKKIEEARGIAESKLINAKAEAEAIESVGNALRKNPEVIMKNAVDKWDGSLPKFMGDSGVVPFVDVNKITK